MLYGIYRFLLSRQLIKNERNRLKAYAELKRRFYISITHELRTPLTLILGNAEEIRGNAKYKKRILQNTKIIRNQIDKILVPPKSNEMQLDLVQAEVINFLKTIVASFDVLANNKHITLSFQPKEEILFMDFDPEKFQQIITNLLSNALKFTPKQGRVTINAEKTLRKTKPFLKIEVKDTGIGIDKKNLERVFEEYFQEKQNRN